MGIDYNFTISQNLEKKLKKLSDESVREVIAGALLHTLEEGAKMVAEDVPSKYADLKASIRVEQYPTAGNLHGSIGSDYPQAKRVEYGTGIYDESLGAARQPIDIVPVHAKVLKFTASDGTVIYTNHVHYDGLHAVAMFRKNIGRIRYRLNRNLKAALERHLGGN